MNLLLNFAAYLLMRIIGRWVRRLVRLVFSLLLMAALGGYAVYRAGCRQLEDRVRVICQGGGDVLDGLSAVHASPWRHVVRDSCRIGDLAVSGCWGEESP